MSEKYFLGVMTENGFSTEFGKQMSEDGYYTYILKGGAGTGKSSLMKKIASEFETTEDVTRYYCSSDPHSLDAVVLHGSKVILCDGTSPHTMDPVYPAACQKIINLGDFWNDKSLRDESEEIIAVTDENKALLSLAKSYQTALSNVNTGLYDLGSKALDTKKLEAYSYRICKKLFHKKSMETGKTEVRQLSAVTENGIMTFTDTLGNYLEVYCLRDGMFAATDFLLRLIKVQATKRGYNVKICPCGMMGNKIYEHILIDELGIAFVSEYAFGKILPEFVQKINLNRFYNKEILSRYKLQTRVAKNCSADLLNKSAETIKSAKVVHDEIEKYYISQMDFDGLNQLCDSLIKEIHNL